MSQPPISPTPREIEAWRLSAEEARKAGGLKLGSFNWPWVILALIAELERIQRQVR